MPSFWASFAATEMLVPASVAMGAAFRGVEADELPLTLVAEEVEECLPEGNHSKGEVELGVVEDDPLEVLVSMVAAVVGPPFRDALRDVEDDESVDEPLSLNSA